MRSLLVMSFMPPHTKRAAQVIIQSLCFGLQPRQVRWSWQQVPLASFAAHSHSLRRICMKTAPINSKTRCQCGSVGSLPLSHQVALVHHAENPEERGMTPAQTAARPDPPPIDRPRGALERTPGSGQEKGQDKATPAQGPSTRPEGRGQRESALIVQEFCTAVAQTRRPRKCKKGRLDSVSLARRCFAFAVWVGGTCARVSESEQKAVNELEP